NAVALLHGCAGGEVALGGVLTELGGELRGDGERIDSRDRCRSALAFFSPRVRGRQPPQTPAEYAAHEPVRADVPRRNGRMAIMRHARWRGGRRFCGPRWRRWLPIGAIGWLTRLAPIRRTCLR